MFEEGELSFESFEIELPKHRIIHKRNGDKLVVSFDNAGAPGREPADRMPWGYKFFSEEGYSILGVIAKEPDWYRCVDLHAELERLEKKGLFRSYKSVVFTGSSMGGYAATAFCSLSQGSTVVSYNPQSTLKADLVPWESNHKMGRSQDWSSAYSDGAEEAKNARKVYIFYDPHHREDRMHAERYSGKNIIRMKSPFLGHGLPESYLKMGCLKEIMSGAIENTLTVKNFSRLMRGRRNTLPYWKNLCNSAIERGHLNSASHICEEGYRRYKDDYFRFRLAICRAAVDGAKQGLDTLREVDRDRRSKKKRAQRRQKKS